MAVITVSDLLLSDYNGTDPTGAGTAASSGGDSFANDGKTILLVRNAGSGTPTISVAPVNSTLLTNYGSLAATSHSAAMAAGNVTVQYLILGPFPKAIYNDGNGRVNIAYTSVSSVSVTPLKLQIVD